MAERAGAITWACSEEDSGPDVGISVSLGDGTELWCGEVSRKLWSEALDDAAALGDDAGYWLVHWKPEPVIVGRCISLEAGQALIDTLAAAFTTLASEREAIGRAAGREEAAKVAETWTSSLRPGSTERLAGHGEAARDIAAAIRALPVDGGKDGA